MRTVEADKVLSATEPLLYNLYAQSAIWRVVDDETNGTAVSERRTPMLA